MLQEYEIQFRVRYQETDAQGRVHHANYINYFEMGRVELLRACGFSYWKLEESGVILVVTEISCRYYQPATFDDLLRLKTRVVRIGSMRRSGGQSATTATIPEITRQLFSFLTFSC